MSTDQYMKIIRTLTKEVEALKQAKEDQKNEKYADSQPHMMDDPFQWFHLVLIANPVPMGAKKDDPGNRRTMLWMCLGFGSVYVWMYLWLGVRVFDW